MEGVVADAARELKTALADARLETEASSEWMPFLITIPDKFKKATVKKLIQLALRAPKAGAFQHATSRSLDARRSR